RITLTKPLCSACVYVDSGVVIIKVVSLATFFPSNKLATFLISFKDNCGPDKTTTPACGSSYLNDSYSFFISASVIVIVSTSLYPVAISTVGASGVTPTT